MKNNKTALLAVLIWAVSALAMAAEPHLDAHDKPGDAHAKAPEKAREKSGEKAAEKADEHAKVSANADEHAAAAKSEVPVLADAPAKPVGQKKKVKKKIRVAQKPADTGKAAHAETAHDKPAGGVAADPHHAAPAAAQAHAHADPHGDSHSNAAASPPAAVSDNSLRPRNRVSTAPVNKDVQADVHTAPHADAHADSHAAAPVVATGTKPDTHAAAIAPVKTTPVLEAVSAVSDNVKEDACNPPLKADIAALFDRWNASLKTGDAKKVVANYATPSILLPTVSNQARFTAAEKEDYFVHFLQRKPEGSINDRMIEVDCNSATDAGLYSFKFADGSVVKARYSFSYKKVGDEWLISSHHSSAMPEKPVVADTHGSHSAPSIALDRNDGALKNGGWIRFP